MKRIFSSLLVFVSCELYVYGWRIADRRMQMDKPARFSVYLVRNSLCFSEWKSHPRASGNVAPVSRDETLVPRISQGKYTINGSENQLCSLYQSECIEYVSASGTTFICTLHIHICCNYHHYQPWLVPAWLRSTLTLDRLRIAFTANGKREIRVYVFSKKRVHAWMRIVKNNSGFWCQRKTTQFRLENENSEPQMWEKHGHVVISVVCRLP